MIRDILSFSKISQFIISSLSLIGIQWAVCLPYLICTLYISQLKDPLPLAAYGLTTTFINLTFVSLVLGIQEKMGVLNSVYFGQHQYKKMGENLYDSYFFSFILVLVYAFLSYHSFSILVFLQIEEDLAFSTSRLLITCIPYIFFQAFNQITENFLSSQKVSKPLMIVNTLSIFVVLIFGKIFFFDFDLKELGFAYTKIVQEAINSIVFIIITIKYSKKEILIKPKFKKILKNIPKFFTKKSLSTLLSYYGEFISFELNMYYAALLYNILELDIWVTIINYSAMYYFTSVGLGFSVRNLVGFEIGKRNFILAKNDSIIYLIYILIIAIILIIFQNLHLDLIVGIYTKNEKIVYDLKKNLLCFSLNIFPTLSFYVFSTLLRLHKLFNFQFYFMVIVYPILSAVLSGIFCFILDFKALGLTLGLSLSKIIICLIFSWKLFWDIDWKIEQSILSISVDDFEENGKKKEVFEELM